MHHAYLHESKETVPDLSWVAAADLIREDTPKLTIEMARELTRRVYTEPVGETKKRAALIVAEQINHEAQNALLKLLEEPPVHTTFHFVMSNQSRLLPTLRSRFEAVATTGAGDTAIAKEVLSLPLSEQLELVATKTSEKDLGWQESLLVGLERLIATKKLSREMLPTLIFVRTKISGPGASAKMLLEHLLVRVAELN